MQNKILTIIFSIILSSVFFVALNYGITQTEKNECVKWQKQSEQFSNFYWTDWQRQQCKINK